MLSLQKIINSLKPDAPSLRMLYGDQREMLNKMSDRWRRLIERFVELFGEDGDILLFSTPGRTEVGGNHTDHNAGRVLAAAVDLDLISAARPTDDGIITVYSEGYPKVVVDTRMLEAQEEERYTTGALIRGICARMQETGWKIGGFNACITSNVPKGSGLSSSAAFEVGIVTILNHLYNEGRIDPVTNAIISQYAENHYFGKPCGLMDQTTCAVGGFVTIDFRDSRNPMVQKLDYDFSRSRHALVIVETGGDHADLTDDYAGITSDMRSVAQALGGKVLRDVSREQVLAALPALRSKVSDRALLRAFHFFDDNDRVVEQVNALEKGNFQRFLELVNESGRSSWMQLQNNYSIRNPQHQGIALAQTLTRYFLGNRGACRVHGGGFAGTIQAFVPVEMVEEYVSKMEGVFGEGTCYSVMIRSAGSVRLNLEKGE
jgi:galactokinase